MIAMTGEVWKPLQGNFVDIEILSKTHQVSNLGRVKSPARKIHAGINSSDGRRPWTLMKRETILRSRKSGNYFVFRFYVGGGDKRRIFDIRGDYLVAWAFVPNPNKYQYIIHLDGDVSNLCAVNLAWVEKQRWPYGRPGGFGVKKTKKQKEIL